MKLKLILIATIIGLFTSQLCYAKHLHLEEWYQERWCNERGGRIEVRLVDGTRCDCIYENYAVEVDFGSSCFSNKS